MTDAYEPTASAATHDSHINRPTEASRNRNRNDDSTTPGGKASWVMPRYRRGGRSQVHACRAPFFPRPGEVMSDGEASVTG